MCSSCVRGVHAVLGPDPGMRCLLSYVWKRLCFYQPQLREWMNLLIELSGPEGLFFGDFFLSLKIKLIC